MDQKVTPITLAELEHRHETIKGKTNVPLSPTATSATNPAKTEEPEEKLIDEP